MTPALYTVYCLELPGQQHPQQVIETYQSGRISVFCKVSHQRFTGRATITTQATLQVDVPLPRRPINLPRHSGKPEAYLAFNAVQTQLPLLSRTIPAATKETPPWRFVGVYLLPATDLRMWCRPARTREPSSKHPNAIMDRVLLGTTILSCHC